VNELRAEELSDAVAALRRGDVIVFPTETLYGLGADALNAVAVEKVFQLKGRDSNNPIPVLVADRPMLNSLVAAIPRVAEKLIERFWPGPLTLVLPARSNIPAPLLSASGSIGVRISSHPITQQLVKLFGRPLTATSANPSGQAGALTVAQARAYFSGAIDIFVEGGELTSKTGSTVAAVIENNIRIIRAGEISVGEIESVLNKGANIE
jgi:L-threonylcarbamoyladenylate synthase